MTSVDDYIARAIDSLNEDNVAEAIQLYREALAVDPTDSTALTGLGAALDEAGQLEDAIDCYKKALGVAPNDVIAHSGLGVAYEKLGETDLATREYQIALTADKDTAFLHMVYARDRHTKKLAKEKEQYEAQVQALEERIARYIDATKIIDRYVSKLFPQANENP
ncbi:MAG: tetratricopeptide repeat protein [Halobacteriota archaeon]